MAMEIEKVIGANIRRLRGGESQAAVGQSLEGPLGAAWSRQQVSAAERGDRDFKAAELVAFAAVLGSSVPELFRADDDVELGESADLPWDTYRQLTFGETAKGSGDWWLIFSAAVELQNTIHHLQVNYRNLVRAVQLEVEANPALQERVERARSEAEHRLRTEWQRAYGDGGSPLAGETFEAWSAQDPELIGLTDALSRLQRL